MRMGGARLAVATVLSLGGAGYHQESFVLVGPGSDGVPRIVWSAVSEETFIRPPLGDSTGKSYRIHGCLFTARDTLLAYALVGEDSIAMSALADHLERPSVVDSLFRRSGYYAVRSGNLTIRFVSEPDSLLVRACRQP
jgi:hypothetical protein